MLLAIVKTDKHTSKLFVKIVCANSYFEKILEDLAEPPPYAESSQLHKNEVFYGTQCHPTVIRWYYRVFFSVFTMGEMIICSMYIVWKKFLHCQNYIKRLDFLI
jgi:hypothetical protein